MRIIFSEGILNLDKVAYICIGEDDDFWYVRATTANDFCWDEEYPTEKEAQARLDEIKQIWGISMTEEMALIEESGWSQII